MMVFVINKILNQLIQLLELEASYSICSILLCEL